MEGSGRQPGFNVPHGQPTSPPATPGTHHARFPSVASHTSPMYKRMPLHNLAQSPPLDQHIEPIGQGPHFNYRRPQSKDLSSRPSSASGPAGAGSLHRSVVDVDPPPRPTFTRSMRSTDLDLEEVFETDPGYDSDIEVVWPDNYEEATSSKADEDDMGVPTGIVRGIEQLRCDGDSDGAEERQRRWDRRRMRWSARPYNKRSHAESVEGASDPDDLEAIDDHDVGMSARRLRRRTRGPNDRSSWIFEDIPHLNIAEVDEPNETGSTRGPPSLPSDDDGFALDALPFWVLEDPMEIDSGSGHSSAPGQH
ncbi:hypothetical protein W97_02986 [Coniosporium apollinis CBS 100218]|uniref:Uncharacterized protein n=1 Tax=Coniosporium apollinis (strain CBS 100218) TaxID=1168221 RepID=R7YPI4_CONA1|nr:uncharacterized protein W97_02986 [Coniosporium apollinis CBS 100218]EON63758.1 hypothetical protein W97_02986 [Coniosporium apollinis CBS 100218]